MKKRSAEESTEISSSPCKMGTSERELKSHSDSMETLCEDPYGDEFEEEEFVFNDDCSSDDNCEEGPEEEQEEEQEDARIPWRLGVDPLGEDEELECDMKAYHMFHRAMLDWSCLSFDVLPDQLGNSRHFPHTVYVVAGTQADTRSANRVYMMKWKNLAGRIRKETSSSSDDSSEDDSDEDSPDPVLDFRGNQHHGVVNRVRCCPQLPRLVATWSDTGDLHMWDLGQQLQHLDEPGSATKSRVPPKFTFSDHKDEGYGMAFSPHQTGMFLSGSCDATIRLWRPVEGGWSVEAPMEAHARSVEDLQWKSLGSGASNVFASCSADGSIKIFDISVSHKPQISINDAHSSDVNSIRWSPFQEDFVLSGGDDGRCHVWDIRNVSEPVVLLHYHNQPISSVDWHPSDSAIFACASLDNSISMWDMSVEGMHPAPDVPQQLMFQHMGQMHVTEIQWHPQISGVLISTAEDGFNIFKTCNI